MLKLKRNITENTAKYIFRSIFLAFVVLPALIIMTPACNPFGKCGKPGYTWTASSCNYSIYWTCSSPCDPSVTEMHFTVGSSGYKTATVYCEDSGTLGYDTSEGTYLTIGACP